MSPMRNPAYLRTLPATFAAAVTSAGDLDAARLQVATALSQQLRADTLVRCARACGLRVPSTGPAAAHALAALAVPALSAQGRH